MPENDVTVDADFEFMLEKDSYDNYIVSTDEELLILSKAVNDGYEAGNVVLTADVTASTENGFEPIGTNDNPYKGNFNGKGHTAAYRYFTVYIIQVTLRFHYADKCAGI